MSAAQYHIAARNLRTGNQTVVTGYAMTHAECMTVISKFNRDERREFVLIPAAQLPREVIVYLQPAHHGAADALRAWSQRREAAGQAPISIRTNHRHSSHVVTTDAQAYRRAMRMIGEAGVQYAGGAA